jgi:hypothetical protein
MELPNEGHGSGRRWIVLCSGGRNDHRLGLFARNEYREPLPFSAAKAAAIREARLDGQKGLDTTYYLVEVKARYKYKPPVDPPDVEHERVWDLQF